jgi:DNA-binding HxlR family transcriptional regulator
MDTKASLPWNIYDDRCPTRLVLGRLADKWTVLVVGQLAQGTRRFGELRREIRGISPKVLTQALRSLERDGLITRRVYASVPPKVEYTLTPLGRTLISLVDGIREWAETHIEAVLEAQQTFDQQAQDVGEPVL